MRTASRKQLLMLGVVFWFCPVTGQDKKIQLPKVLSRTYFSFEMGSIHYSLSNDHLEPGFQANRIHIPHLGVRIKGGYRFTDHFSGQISFMRPGPWMYYENINGDSARHGVWLTVSGISAKAQLPLAKSLSISGEAGLSIVTRHGFKIKQADVIKDISYPGFLLGGAIQYHLNRSWDLSLNTTYSPGSKKNKQPHTIFYSSGITFKLNNLTDEQVRKNAEGKWIIPEHLIQFGFSSNIAGYSANKFFSNKIPIFWAGHVEAKHGFVLAYQRNIFHSRKVFSLNWGANISYWRTVPGSDFFSLALFPVFRATLIQASQLDGYLQYSIAGPAFISKRVIDGFDTGRKFTFQDLMGVGFLAGSKKSISIEFMLGHYSNGNIFPRNAGIQLPLQLNLGYAFDKL